jgi:hypothetical protein
MKKLLFVASLLFLSPLISEAASNNVNVQREYESYQDTGLCMFHEDGTTSATALLVTTVTIPSCAKGFRLTPVTTPIIYSIEPRVQSNYVEAALSSSAGVAITTTTLNIGNRAFNDEEEVRLLPCDEYPCEGRKMYLMSTGTSVDFYIEFF